MSVPSSAAQAPPSGTPGGEDRHRDAGLQRRATLEETFRAIPQGYYDEIVVVDDHSRDDTVERRERLNLKAIRHPHNVGYGGNQKTCYMEALRDGATSW